MVQFFKTQLEEISIKENSIFYSVFINFSWNQYSDSTLSKGNSAFVNP